MKDIQESTARRLATELRGILLKAQCVENPTAKARFLARARDKIDSRFSTRGGVHALANLANRPQQRDHRPQEQAVSHLAAGILAAQAAFETDKRLAGEESLREAMHWHRRLLAGGGQTLTPGNPNASDQELSAWTR